MISVIILAHNDAGTLERALVSVAWCDERIVIDDYSTDITADIAKECDAKVFRRHLDGDFAAQRNFGLSKAGRPARRSLGEGGEWVLFIDSDEEVSPQLAKEIRQVVTMPNVKCQMLNGFIMKRKDWFFGRWLTHGETASVKLLRLAKKNAGVWVRPVHEIWQVQGKVGILSAPLLHYPHPNVAQFLEEINQYSTLNAQYLFGQGIKVSWWHIPAYPLAKFFLNYVWRLGFLDGVPGALVAFMMSFHSFLTRAKLWVCWDRYEAHQ